MSVLSNNTLAGSSGQGGAGGYEIERSLRFNGHDSAFLSKTPSSSGNLTTWTMSVWVKNTLQFTSSPYPCLFGANNYNGSRTFLRYLPSGVWEFFGSGNRHETLEVYRDPSAWYHLVLKWDTGNSTAADRVILYINGVRQTWDDTFTANATCGFNANVENYIGKEGEYPRYLNAYLADYHFIDGQALAASDFGKYDDSNVWQPKEFAGTYGTNGFHLDFSDNSSNAALGTDSSGNGNDWTVNNIQHNSTLNSFNLDVTSTPFADTGRGLTITNNGSVGTSSAGTNSFNLTTVASLGGSGTGDYLRTPSITMSANYTIDYYFNATSDQTGNGTVIDAGGEAIIRDYGSATNRKIRLTGGVDYSYNTSADTWTHVRVTNTGIWVNGALVTSSPVSCAGVSGQFSMGTYATSTGYLFKGKIGPVRISDKDLGAPATGGLVANSGGTLSNVIIPNHSVGSLLDSPVNGDSANDTGAGGEISGNYATWNPVDNSGSVTLSDGNLKATSTSSNKGAFSTISMTSGKWFWEQTIQGSNSFVGIADQAALATARGYASSNALYYYGNTGTTYATLAGFTAGTSVGATFGAGDVIGTALDMDNGTVAFYKNGTLQNTLTPTGLSNYKIVAAMDNGGGAATVNVLNAGQHAFAYTAPSGYKCLCTANLPDPTIADGSKYFDTKLYTGNGGTQSITSYAFSPDFVWLKKRSSSGSHSLHDVIRGATKRLSSDSTSAETTETTAMTAFNSDGFSLGSDGNSNASGQTFAAWAWDAGSSTVTNTDGSISSQVRANPSAGFSIVSWTGTANATVGHGLNSAPRFVITKKRNGGTAWRIWSAEFTNASANYLGFDTAAAGTFGGTYWGSMTSTTIGLAGLYDNNNGDMIAYCFAPVEGYSAFGSYEGNASNDGPFVYTGFRPAFVLTKWADGIDQWQIHDTARSPENVANEILEPNTNGPEQTYTYSEIDILSNGFKVRNSYQNVNAASTYIYAAFAENPFKTSRAR